MKMFLGGSWTDKDEKAGVYNPLISLTYVRDDKRIFV